MSVESEHIIVDNLLSRRAEGAGSYAEQAAELVERMTLEEKALLLSGDGLWCTHGIERLGIPAILMTDGPHGVRKEVGGLLGASAPATCFPTASALAASWNVDLVHDVGSALAAECRANDVRILLGPGVNIKRSPLGGRNFEYFSEDPLLAGRMAIAFIDGVQGGGVGTSLKHFAANSQEFERMVCSSNLDERTLHEIYLPAFEMAVKEAQPWTVMCAYNRVNGVGAAEHRHLLRDILRDRWGFQGFVVSDWGAVNDRVEALAAGTNLEMPGSGDHRRKQIIAAVQSGWLPMSTLDDSVREFVAVVLRTELYQGRAADFDSGAHNALARRAAAESIVLLKNESGILPLRSGRRLAVIGSFAREPRFQGAGSSQVNPTRITSAWDELVRMADAKSYTYAAGYDDNGDTNDTLIAEARDTAADADVAVVFAGLPARYESEGFDRTALDMPEGHNRLIEAVTEVQPNVVVVLVNGAAVTMPWADSVEGIVEAWLSGQAGGGAVADILTGRANPSGKLAETFPQRLEDTPTFPNFPARGRQAHYGEGIYVGYRYYDSLEATLPLFPFGYGLSYTTFAYTALHVQVGDDGESAIVDVTVRNTGTMGGAEVVQVYVRECAPVLPRPDKELKGFAKLHLESGEEKTVTLALDRRAFASYDVVRHDWIVRSGWFEILAGASSRDLPLREAIAIDAAPIPPPPMTHHSMLKELRMHPIGAFAYAHVLEAFGFEIDPVELFSQIDAPEHLREMVNQARESRVGARAEPAETKKELQGFRAFLEDMPLSKLPALSQGRLTEEMLDELINQLR